MVAHLGRPERSVGRAGWARQDRFGGRRSIAQRAVWPDDVRVLPPAFDQYLCLLQAVEDFPVQEFVSELTIAKGAPRYRSHPNLDVSAPIDK